MFFLGSAPMRAGFVEKLSAQLLLDEPFTGNLAFGDLNAPVDVSCCTRRAVGEGRGNTTGDAVGRDLFPDYESGPGASRMN